MTQEVITKELPGATWSRRWDEEDRTTYFCRNGRTELAACSSVVADILMDTGLFTDSEARLFTERITSDLQKNFVRAIMGL